MNDIATEISKAKEEERKRCRRILKSAPCQKDEACGCGATLEGHTAYCRGISEKQQGYNQHAEEVVIWRHKKLKEIVQL